MRRRSQVKLRQKELQLLLQDFWILRELICLVKNVMIIKHSEMKRFQHTPEHLNNPILETAISKTKMGAFPIKALKINYQTVPAVVSYNQITTCHKHRLN